MAKASYANRSEVGLFPSRFRRGGRAPFRGKRDRDDQRAVRQTKGGAFFGRQETRGERRAEGACETEVAGIRKTEAEGASAKDVSQGGVREAKDEGCPSGDASSDLGAQGKETQTASAAVVRAQGAAPQPDEARAPAAPAAGG